MANLEDRLSRRWPSHIAEKFVPTSFWTQDAEGNDFLHIDLSGFKHEEVRLELASADHIKIEGERIVNENKCIYIDQTFPLPENSDTVNIIGKFEGEHLYITVPKMNGGNIGNGNNSTAEQGSQEEEDEKEEESNNNGENQAKHEQGHVLAAAIQSSHDSKRKGKSSKETCCVASFPNETIKKWEEKDSPLAIAIKCLKRNKGIVLSVVISFSIGVWVSKLWIY